MTAAVTYGCNEGVATITLDDGKVNVMTLALLGELFEMIQRARGDEAIILIRSGRDNIFSAGFDMKTLASDDRDARRALVEAGVKVITALLEHPYPVVTLCSGHAYPMGAFLLLASDVRIGVEGDYRIGMNEVAIGIAVPDFAIELARHRLTATHLHRTIALGQMFGPRDANEAGFLDMIVERESAESTVQQIIGQLGQIDMAAHASTKRRLRSGVINAIKTAARDRLVPTA